MKWKVEYITEDSTNILIDDPMLSDMNKEPVALGFPKASLAENLVRVHNEAIDTLKERLRGA